ncbi:CTB family bacteriocin [Nostoc sp. LEGE 12450]|uniref:CTB family bacteriocin n=1 Tax=Nostoc sp. LEGE 12450 TaxID=1828643 RepID=UPI0018801BB3|nr:CTB family bacteriocin [Nostoc sp. LEGE 12450]MBE8985808.1 CTB family bacteriocin [Nostoc sp. LEGE 12450]
MSYQINTSKLFVELLDEQQELVAGGVDSQRNQSNFARRLTKLDGRSRSGPNGSEANSQGSNDGTQTSASQGLQLGGAAVIPALALPTLLPGLFTA